MEHEKYMREALREASYAAAEDEVPIGAVIICRGRIVGKGHNMTEKLNDPTAHAEMIAITAATEALGGKYLNDCTLYVTVEPCPMCAGAIINSRIKNVYFGAKDMKNGAVVSAAQNFGAWKMMFIIPGIIAAIGIFVTAAILRDTPKSVGLPELSEGNEKKEESSETSAELSAFIRKHVWQNPIIWALAVADFFVYVIRFAVLDWGPTFLREHCGMNAEWAGVTVFVFEIFGVIGMLIAGWASDKLFKGRSARTCLICMIGTLVSVLGFIGLQKAGASPVVLLFVLALAGAFIYGPQALIGVISSNHATRKGSATALGIIGFVSYVSVLVSGWGFGLIADSKYGWNGVFVAMVVMAIIGAAIFVPMWKMKRDAYSDAE